jgi:hypothetical protein
MDIIDKKGMLLKQYGILPPHPLGDGLAQFKQRIIDTIARYVKTPQQALEISIGQYSIQVARYLVTALCQAFG